MVYQVSTAAQYIGRAKLTVRRPDTAKSVHFSEDSDAITPSSQATGTSSIDFAVFANTSSSETASDSSSLRPEHSHDSLTVAKLEGRTASRLGVATPGYRMDVPEQQREFSFAGSEQMTVLTPKSLSSGPGTLENMIVASPGSSGPGSLEFTIVSSPTSYSPIRPKTRGKDLSVTPPSHLTGAGTQFPRLPPVSLSPSNSAGSELIRVETPPFLRGLETHLAAAGTQYPPLPRLSHTPSKSSDSDKIYFSPIEGRIRDSVFLSSPQASPPRTPESTEVSGASMTESEVAAVAAMVRDIGLEKKQGAKQVEKKEVTLGDWLTHMTAKSEAEGTAASADFAEMTKPQEKLEKAKPTKSDKITLTIKQVDELAIALAASPIVQSAISSKSDPPTESPLPLPISSTGAGGTALIDSSNRIATSSSPSVLTLHKYVPKARFATATASLHVLPSRAEKESAILLQTLMPLTCRSGRPRTLLTETDFSFSFTTAALHEVAASLNLSLDNVEIAKAWVRDEEVQGAVDLCLQRIGSMTREDCTMQTLTLLSQLARVQAGNSDVVVVKPGAGEFRVPFLSQALDAKFADGEAMRRFEDAVLAHVEPHFEDGEEFDVVVKLPKSKRTVRLGCVPMMREVSRDAQVEHWVCFVGREPF